MAHRFNADGPDFDFGGFGGPWLVACTRCGRGALLRSESVQSKLAGWRVTCQGCGCTRQWRIPPHRLQTLDGTGEVEFWYDPAVAWKHVGRRGTMTGSRFHHVPHRSRRLESFPLWLRANCCGKVLWAINADHANWMRDYVAANLRETSRDPVLGWHNRGLATRLPDWIKAANNRGRVLHALDGLLEHAQRP